jgi:hypothetical protein
MSGAGEFLQPGRLWSLWDMLEFHAHRFVECMTLLNEIRFSLVRKESFLYSGGYYKTVILEQLQRFTELLQEMNLRFTEQAVERLTLLIMAETPIPPPPEIPMLIEQRISDVTQRLRDELETKLFICVETPKLYTQDTPLFGGKVDLAFPMTARDIDEAGKCLALHRPTACVMHLMRVFEIGIQSLADELGVPFKENWNALLDQIERVIPTISKSAHGADAEQWFAEAATHFRFIKNAWRNHAMHVNERYTEDEAETILQHTKAFMQHLATKLSDPLGKLLA